VLLVQEINLFDSDVSLRMIPRAAPIHSTIHYLRDLPHVPTSHGTTKQQLVEEFSVHPDLAGISIAKLLQGQTIKRHVHKSMHEFFFVFEGEVEITVDYYPDRPITNVCRYGCFFHGIPGEPHEFKVRADAPNYAKMIVMQLVESKGKVELAGIHLNNDGTDIHR
jgi:quercetin dioxygenase-like cupin family protein